MSLTSQPVLPEKIGNVGPSNIFSNLGSFSSFSMHLETNYLLY
jgi:hypothetical protein